ncbi:hypothetical protein EBB07_33660 [Paenibacillaceae bacterium]|nr:hypothetical protein EBB07_33660 [Paenibacillaceae bacterium]
MNIAEMYEKVKEIYEANEDKYYFIGLRFEDKEREIGEVCEYSRHNADRDDERDFPEFGSEEYDDLPELNGTSAWNMDPNSYGRVYSPGFGSRISAWHLERTCEKLFVTDHCYVIAGEICGSHEDPDANEILIKEAIVIAKIF